MIFAIYFITYLGIYFPIAYYKYEEYTNIGRQNVVWQKLILKESALNLYHFYRTETLVVKLVYGEKKIILTADFCKNKFSA